MATQTSTRKRGTKNEGVGRLAHRDNPVTGKGGTRRREGANYQCRIYWISLNNRDVPSKSKHRKNRANGGVKNQFSTWAGVKASAGIGRHLFAGLQSRGF